MASRLGCITQVPNHRHAAYGVAAVQDIAWTGLRSREACRIMQRMLLTKASCVGGTVLLYLLGILKRSRYEPTPHLMTAHAFGFTSSHVEQYGMHATGRHRSGSTLACTIVLMSSEHGGPSCRKEQRSFVDLDSGPHLIYTKLAMQRP